MAKDKSSSSQKKVKRSISSGRVYINASFNNTIITITDSEGNALAWSSSGSCGFKGSKKATPYAGQVAAEKAYSAVKNYGLTDVYVFIKGIGSAREQAVRGLIAGGANILGLVDTTPMPHGGCRVRKARRV